MKIVLWYFVFGPCFYPAFLVIRQQFFHLVLKQDVGLEQRLSSGTICVLLVALFLCVLFYADVDSEILKSFWLHTGATIVGFLFLPVLFEILIHLQVLKRKLKAPDPGLFSR
jgi:hypothetical protein